MSLLDSARWVVRQFGTRTRRSYAAESRTHIEFRPVEGAELMEFTRLIEEGFAALDGVSWVEVNPITCRVVVSHSPGCTSRERFRPVVESAEKALCLDRSPGTPWRASDHPADIEPIERLLLELGSDVAGLVIGLALRLSPVPRSRVASNALAAIAILRRTRVRQLLEERLGKDRAEAALEVLCSFLQAAAQRPSSSLVELLARRVFLREAQSRREVWIRREPDLCRTKNDPVGSLGDQESRPVPLPRGPIEEYADRAWLLSLAGFGVSFVSTRSLQRAVAALPGALPRPARLGRDVYSAELSRALAARNVLILDPDAIRRLDRVDTLVLQGDLVSRDRYEIGEITAVSGISRDELRRRTEALFDADHATDLRTAEGWALGPSLLFELQGDLSQRSIVLSRRGALVLALAREQQVTALVEMRIVPQTGAEELLILAHEAGLRVVIASADDSAFQGMHADDIIPPGIPLKSGIRRLQRQGRTVCLVATGSNSEALAGADLGIGLIRSSEPQPWGADLICGEDLNDVRFILRACGSARTLAKQSVNIALGAATLGTLVATGSAVTEAGRHVLSVANLASLISIANGLRSTSELERHALPPPRDRTPWHALDAQGVLHRLGTSERGLGRTEIQRRLPGRRRERSAAFEFFECVTDELFNPLAPLLAAGAGLSAVVGSMSDASMVAGVVAVNALVGGLQRFTTERAIRDLSRSARPKALVRRAGLREEIDPSELVPGDLIELRPGDVVPADCRILEAASLEIDTSSLTGESLPVKKSASPSIAAALADRASMLYEGTSVAAGRATAIVVAVGEATEAQRAVAGAPRNATLSGVDQRLRSLVNLTGPLALGAGSGVVALGLLRGRKLQDLIGSGVSLAVASVPEGLPLLATAAQLASAKRLAQRGALVRNPRSIEALGRVQILCVDKTGTVTEGRIDLVSLSDGSLEEPLSSLTGPRLSVLAAALRATPVHRHEEKAEDPTDVALVRGAARVAVLNERGYPGWAHHAELAFEAARGYHAVYGVHDGGALVSVKGAPEVLLKHCTTWHREGHKNALEPVDLQQLHILAGLLAHRGLRVLAVAERELTQDQEFALGRLEQLTFRGFLAFSDPVRPSAKVAFERLRSAGVEPVMLTGDHPSTARAIATELGLTSGEIISGADLSMLSDAALDEQLLRTSVFARVTPTQKVRVVRAFQRIGKVVGMVGDGANDAPAIRLADVGIAIGERSTSAARGAADVVVTDERIETLVDAIVEGRAMWASVRDAVSILVGGNLGEIGFTLAAGLVDGKPPLHPRQLLLVNVLTDVAPAMAIALRPTPTSDLEALATQGPDAFLGEQLNRDIGSRALVTAGGAGLAWSLGRILSNPDKARTIGLLSLVGTQLGQTLVSGGATPAVIATSVASAAVLAGIVQTPALSQFFGCRPLGPISWGIAIGSSAAATGASVLLPKAITQLATSLKLDRVVPFESSLEASPSGSPMPLSLELAPGRNDEQLTTDPGSAAKQTLGQ